MTSIREAKTESPFKEEVRKEIDRILAIENDEKRWRAIRDFAVKSSPEARLEDKDVQRWAKEIRDTHPSEFAGSTKSGLRWGLKLPATVATYLELFDPTIFNESQEIKQRKDRVRKLMKIFPEYRIPRKI